MYEWEDRIMGCFMILAGILLLALVIGVMTMPIDIYLDRKTFDTQMACKAKRMIPERRALSTKVVCNPAITRQDSITATIISKDK